jgi:hypothetical protein
MAFSQFAFALLFLSVYLYEVSFFIPESPLSCVFHCVHMNKITPCGRHVKCFYYPKSTLDWTTA